MCFLWITDNAWFHIQIIQSGYIALLFQSCLIYLHYAWRFNRIVPGHVCDTNCNLCSLYHGDKLMDTLH